MARPIEETDDPPVDPGTPGYVPPTAEGTALAVVTTNSNYTFTADVITANGGPWPEFTIRVTPINDNGVGPYQEYAYPPPSA